MCNSKFQFGSGAEAAKVTVSSDGELIIEERNAPTLEATKRLSDYLNTLDCLTSEQHNKLIELMLAHLVEAEKGAFLAGAGMAAAALSESTEAENKRDTKILQ